MSEQVFDRPTEQPETDQPKGGRRGPVIIGLAIVSVLVLAGIALLLLGMRPDEQEQAAAPAPKGAPSASATPQAPVTKAPKKSTAQVSGRDPFAALVTPTPTKPPTTPKASASAQPAANPSSPSAKASTTGAAAPENASRPATGDTLAVTSISPLGDTLKLKLNGKKYEIAEGEAFARDYRLYDIFNANCAGFLHGDSNTVACVGDQVKL